MRGRNILLALVAVLLPSVVSAAPITDFAHLPCGCEVEEVIPPPNTDPDPPQTYEEWLADKLWEPAIEYRVYCPPASTPTPEPAVAGLAIAYVLFRRFS